MDLTPSQAAEVDRAMALAGGDGLVVVARRGIPGAIVVSDMDDASVLDFCMMIAGARSIIEGLIDDYAAAQPQLPVRTIVDAAAKAIRDEVDVQSLISLGRRAREGGPG